MRSGSGVNDPRTALLSNGTAIVATPTGSTELVSDDLPVFPGGLRADGAKQQDISTAMRRFRLGDPVPLGMHEHEQGSQHG
jgi:hypothetical protein